MHGYDVNATLEERNIRDWAHGSRPQIYYSLDKLLRLKLIRLAQDEQPAAGPERRVSVQRTSKGRDQLADALDAKHWVEDNVYQPFLIWLALSWQAPADVFRKQIQMRKALLIDRISEERKTLKEVLKEVGHPHHEAVWMIELVIEQVDVGSNGLIGSWILGINVLRPAVPVQHDFFEFASAAFFDSKSPECTEI